MARFLDCLITMKSINKVKKKVILVGIGSYGAVVGATDTRLPEESREKVAIKKMTNVF